MSETIDYSSYDRDQLINFLRLRDRQADAQMRAAKKAIAGDDRELRNRVEMIETPSPGIILSSKPIQR